MMYSISCIVPNCRLSHKIILADREQIEAHFKGHDSEELHRVARELGLINNDGIYHSKNYLATRIFEYLATKNTIGGAS